MAEIQSRLAYVSCERQLAQVKSGMEKCYHIRPPIDRYATLQFGSFDEIEETGYKHGTDIVSAWVKGLILSTNYFDCLPQIFQLFYLIKLNFTNLETLTLTSEHVPQQEV